MCSADWRPLESEVAVGTVEVQTKLVCWWGVDQAEV